MMYLYILNTKVLDCDDIYNRYYQRVSSHRRSRIDAYRFRRDRNLSLGAGIILDQALSLHGLRERDMRYGFGDDNKPYFVQAPHIHFNISHSGELVIVAVGNREVGCDVEKIADIDLAIAERFYCREEYRYIMSFGKDDEKLRAFYRLWTLKECFMKLTGMGMKLPPNAFRMDIQSEAVSVAYKPEWNHVKFVEISMGEYQISVCAMDLQNIQIVDVNAMCAELNI